jgi:hypothetical protein
LLGRRFGVYLILRSALIGKSLQGRMTDFTLRWCVCCVVVLLIAFIE